MPTKHIFLNVALHTELPDHLIQYLAAGADQSPINDWSMEQLRRLLDGEEVDSEFGAELIAIQIKNPPRTRSK